MNATPARATRSSVKAARARGDAGELLCSLPDTGRKPKAAPYLSVRIPFSDVVNFPKDLETHAEFASKPTEVCKPSTPPAEDASETVPSEATTEECCDAVSVSEAGSIEHSSDSSASSHTFCDADLASEDAHQMSDQLVQQLASPDVRLTARTGSPIQGPNSPSPGRWETDVISSPEAAVQDVEAPMTVLKSKVVVQDTFDPRSMRQLKKEYQQLKAAKAAVAAGGHSTCFRNDEAEESEAPSDDDAGSEAEELTAALDGLRIHGPNAGSKVGIPMAKGAHLRFEGTEEEGVPMPGADKVILRGIPQAAGRHTRFD